MDILSASVEMMSRLLEVRPSLELCLLEEVRLNPVPGIPGVAVVAWRSLDCEILVAREAAVVG